MSKNTENCPVLDYFMQKIGGNTESFFIIPCTFRHIGQLYGVFKHALVILICAILRFHLYYKEILSL